MAEKKTGEKQAGRVRGRFAPGVSGNPRGRPEGSRNRTSSRCAELLGADAEDIMAQLIAQAKAGDGVALRLCVERLVPVRSVRDRLVEVDLPEAGRRAVDLVEAAASVIDQAARGKITLSEAREFISLLEAERKLVETADLAIRIEALESDRLRAAVDRGLGSLSPEAMARVRLLAVDDPKGE